MKITLTSFGRKYGIVDADIVLDVRCLENPFWVAELKEKSGLEPEVQGYIFSNPDSRRYLQLLSDLLKLQVKLAITRSRKQLHIAIGCTGGRHRSVAVTEFLAKELKDHDISVIHRDIKRG